MNPKMKDFGMKVTAAGIDRIKIGNADANGQGAHFVVWLYLQVDEGGTQTGQELVVSVPYDAQMTFDEIATQAFEKAHALLVACCEIDKSMWWKQFNHSLAPLPEWTPGAQ